MDQWYEDTAALERTKTEMNSYRLGNENRIDEGKEIQATLEFPNYPVIPNWQPPTYPMLPYPVIKTTEDILRDRVAELERKVARLETLEELRKSAEILRRGTKMEREAEYKRLRFNVDESFLVGNVVNTHHGKTAEESLRDSGYGYLTRPILPRILSLPKKFFKWITT